jgi:hypothetical protein
MQNRYFKLQQNVTRPLLDFGSNCLPILFQVNVLVKAQPSSGYKQNLILRVGILKGALASLRNETVRMCQLHRVEGAYMQSGENETLYTYIHLNMPIAKCVFSKHVESHCAF